MEDRSPWDRKLWELASSAISLLLFLTKRMLGLSHVRMGKYSFC